MASFFLGRPRERSVESRHNLRAVRCNQGAAPKGVPRTTERRTAFNSASVSARFTWLTHSLPAGNGQAVNVLHGSPARDATSCTNATPPPGPFSSVFASHLTDRCRATKVTGKSCRKESGE